MLEERGEVDIYVLYSRGRFQGFIPAQAIWRGGPSREKIREIQRTHFFDSDNIWKGGYGAMYKLDETSKKWRKLW